MGYIARDAYKVLDLLRLRLNSHGTDKLLGSPMLEMYIGMRESSSSGDKCAYAQKAKYLFNKHDLVEIEALIHEASGLLKGMRSEEYETAYDVDEEEE